MTVTIECTEDEAQALRQLLDLKVPAAELVRIVEQSLTVQKNKQALHRFQKEVFNGHDWSIETLSKHLTEDFIDHAAMPGDLPGLEGVQSRFTYWNMAFADAEEDNIEMVGEGDMLAVLYDLHARHTGEYLGIPATNREVVIPGIEFLRFRDGKIAEHWGIYDFMSTAEEIGANLTFTLRPEATEPRRPEVPWARPLLVGEPARGDDGANGDSNGHQEVNGNGDSESEQLDESSTVTVSD
jgi:predicted ester cyclase